MRQREQRDAATGATIAKARSSKIVDSYGGGGDTDDDSSSVGSSSYFSDAGSAAMTSKSSSNVSKHSPLYCIKNMTRATVLCMVLIFFKRVALEVSLSSSVCFKGGGRSFVVANLTHSFIFDSTDQC